MSSEPLPSTMLAARGVAFARAGRFVVAGVDLDLRAGDRVALLGNNGAGKSTFLSALAGVLAHVSGHIAYDGRELRTLSLADRVKAFSWLPQSLWRGDHFTVRQFLALRAEWNTSGESVESVDYDGQGDANCRALSDFGVGDLLSEGLHDLSGGEWRRVQLAKAFAPRARVLLLDEPSAGLDLLHVFALVAALKAATEGGVSADGSAGASAAVFSTHDLAFAAAAATHVLVLDEGRGMSFGTLDAFCSSGAAERLFGVPVRWRREGESGRRHWFPHVTL